MRKPHLCTAFRENERLCHTAHRCDCCYLVDLVHLADLVDMEQKRKWNSTSLRQWGHQQTLKKKSYLLPGSGGADPVCFRGRVRVGLLGILPCKPQKHGHFFFSVYRSPIRLSRCCWFTSTSCRRWRCGSAGVLPVRRCKL